MDNKYSLTNAEIKANLSEEPFVKFLAEIIVEIIIKQTSTPNDKKSRNH